MTNNTDQTAARANAAFARHVRWHRYFLRLATETASMSKDPSSRVGAVLVRPDRTVISTGFNGFPRGIDESPERLNNREYWLSMTVHAERNALLTAAKHGTPTNDSPLYMVWYDAVSGEHRGGTPCANCMLELVQAGVRRIVIYTGDVPERWQASMDLARTIIVEAGVTLIGMAPHGITGVTS